MATNRTLIRHLRRGRLTHEQDMVLQYGADDRWADAFRDEDEHRDAWIRNRDRLLAWYRHGHRPAAWWQFEAGDLRYPGYDREQSTLYQAGILGEEEAAALMSEWRREFERAQAADFWLCLGPGRFLKGAPARRRHYEWADVPKSLLVQWTKERRRGRKIIRELEEASSAETTASESAAR